MLHRQYFFSLDLFFFWLLAFYNFSNSSSQHLKFTISSDDCHINFLDILVIKENNRPSTDLYRKPTDRNSLLHGDSYHHHSRRVFLWFISSAYAVSVAQISFLMCTQRTLRNALESEVILLIGFNQLLKNVVVVLR